MKKKTQRAWKELVPLWTILLFIVMAVSILIIMLPYLVNNYFFEIGFDTGIYERLLVFYLDSSSWEVLPAYPAFPEGYSQYVNQVEPGLFVVLGVANQFFAADVNLMHRYFLPILMGVLSVVFGFIAGRHVSGSNLAGILAAIFISTSYVQIEAINESFHRLILATLLLILSAVYFDRFLKLRKGKYMLLSAFLASGTLAFHISVTMLFGFLLVYAVAYFVYTGQRRCLKVMILCTLVAALLSIPAWLPRIDNFLNLLRVAILESAWRSSTLPTGEGLWTSGGAIPELLWGYPHILIGYISMFLPLVILAFLSYVILWRERKLNLAIPLLSLFLWIYIGLWLFFGNRFLLSLDILVCIVAPSSAVYAIRRFGNRRWKKMVIGAIVLTIMIPNFYIVIHTQTQKSPYIVENIEGVEWILENIDPENSVIFAPDYLSANIIQLGYDMAIWDYSLVIDSGHPSYYAELFMIEAPTNSTFIGEFFGNNPIYREKNIYVLWGEWDLDRPLVKTQQLIPVNDYSASPNFRLDYDGYAEILVIFKYVGPRP